MQGSVKPAAAAKVAKALHDMGCYEVSMGDTTGVGTAGSIASMFRVPFRVLLTICPGISIYLRGSVSLCTGSHQLYLVLLHLLVFLRLSPVHLGLIS